MIFRTYVNIQSSAHKRRCTLVSCETSVLISNASDAFPSTVMEILMSHVVYLPKNQKFRAFHIAARLNIEN